MYSKQNMKLFTCFSTVFIIITYVIFNFIYSKHPKPFIDEIFHIPQAQNYCKGLFKQWDPKITTLPGLYILSFIILSPISYILKMDLCGVYHLRFINFLSYCGNLFIIYMIQSKLFKRNQKTNKLKDILSAINLSCFPLLYFFTFLYYTDSISTLFVLISYYFFLNDSTRISAFIGFLSIIVRQTNIIWVIFMILISLFSILKEIKIKQKIYSWPPEFIYIGDLISSLYHLLRSGLKGWRLFLSASFKKFGDFIFICILFAIFILWNGSLVVGDKSAHQAVIHFPQLYYFSLFTLFFAFPFLMVNIFELKKFIWKYKKALLVSIIISIVIIKYNTLVHLYLISDNRHYSFYIWKNIYQRHYLIKYLLIPIYILAIMAIINKLKQMDNAFQLAFILCTSLIIIPQKLLEFRYFILPYLMFRIHVKSDSWRQLLLEFFIYNSINFLTIYVFVSKTFKWNDSEEVQRIIW